MGYPTVIFFKHGKPLAYTGGRSSEDIIEWTRTKALYDDLDTPFKRDRKELPSLESYENDPFVKMQMEAFKVVYNLDNLSAVNSVSSF